VVVVKYVVSIPLPFWSCWPNLPSEVRRSGEEEARKLGATLPDSEPRIISGIDTMRYAQWRWEE